MKPIIAFCLLLLATPSIARIGENETACALRYNHGKDVPPDPHDQMFPLLKGPNTTNRTYKYQGWNIKIGFIQGIASVVQYSIAGQNIRAITPEEVRAILDGSGGLAAWRQVKSSDFKQRTPVIDRIFRGSGDVWWRSDGSFAQLPAMRTYFRIENELALKLEAEAARPTQRTIPKF